MGKAQVTSGLDELDRLLGGGIIIGDNVVWYDDAGSLAFVFSSNLIQASKAGGKSVIYISFDRSPKNLIEKLGPLTVYPGLTILDCFTHGKGGGSDVFLDFYEEGGLKAPCRIIKVKEPKNVDQVTHTFYDLHKTMEGDVRFVFDSLTGMQELWGGEDDILTFYSQSCPRLYELNTIAYWVVENKAHSPRLKAHLNKTTQVAVELSLKRGKTSLTILKAEQRDFDLLNNRINYRSKDSAVFFHDEKRHTGRPDIGLQVKDLRSRAGFSQTELAKLVGVTPSTISQVESNQIYPSLPSLIKMAEILSVEMSTFFPESPDINGEPIFSLSNAVDVYLPGIPKDTIISKRLCPVDRRSRFEPYLIKFPPKTKISTHFFFHKKEEFGYLLSGRLSLKTEKGFYMVKKGDVIRLKADMPSQWENKENRPAILLWLNIK